MAKTSLNPTLPKQKPMKTYRIKMIQEYIESYDIQANSEQEAIAEIYKDFLEPDDTKAGNSHVKNIEVIAS